MKLTIAMLGVFPILISCTICESLDMYSSYYSTMNEAVENGAIRRGWIPRYLPNSARNIREAHDIDSNEVWISFVFDKNDFLEQDESCHKVDLGIVNFPKRKSKNVRWWHKGLTMNSSSWKNSFEYYRCKCIEQKVNIEKKQECFMAIDLRNKMAFFWRTYPK